MVRSLSLRKKLVLSVFAASGFATTLTVLTSGFLDYRTEMSQFEKVITSIETQNLNTLSKLAWDLNESQIQFQLDSLVKLPEVVSVEVQLNEGQSTLSAQQGQQTEDSSLIHTAEFIPVSDVLEKKYVLSHVIDQETHQVGTLTIRFNEGAVVDKVLSTLLTTIGLNFFKALAISLFLLYVFQLLVTSRVERLARQIQILSKNRFEGGYTPKLKPKIKHPFMQWDEIHSLEMQIRRMASATEKTMHVMEERITEQEVEIENQRAKSIYASKMAALGEMASGVAHEINNPLTVMSTKLQLLDRKVLTLMSKRVDSSEQRDELQKFFEHTRSEIQRLGNLCIRISKIVKGLKFFARDGSHDPKEWVSLEDIFTDTIQLVEQRLKSHGVELKSTCVPIEINCRAVELSQVLINLISNSSDAIAALEEKWIRLEARLDESDRVRSESNQSYLIIEVIDSGHGIPKSLQDRLMEPFFTTKPVGKGTGLGLSISKGIIAAHHGILRLNTSHPHTCFEIQIPATELRTSLKKAV